MEEKVNFDIAFPMMQDYLDKVSSRICRYHPSDDEYVCEIMFHLRSFSKLFYKGCYDEIVRDFQKTSGHRCIEKLSKEDWGEMLQIEEKTLEASKGNERGLINAMLRMSRANKLCCTSYNYEETHIIFNWINNKNLFMVFRLVLRLNILLSETFPDTLKPQFEAWLKGEAYENPEPAQSQEEKNHGLKLTNEGKEKPKEGIGRPIKQLFEPDKEEEMKDCFIKYMEKKKVVNNFVLTCDSPYEQLNAIVSWLKQLEEDKILAPKFPRASVLRFMQNCGFKYPNEDKTYTNVLARKLNDEKPVRHEKFI